MSYLSGPGLTFSGGFQADVPTLNNARSNYGLPVGSEPPVSRENWNPTGSGAFRLLDCAVTGALGAGDRPDTPDPIRTSHIDGADDRVAAKIVDLDPQYQFASELWGLRVRIVDADGEVLLAGEFDPAGFRDIWFTGGQARYQSVLDDLTWAEAGRSATIDRLRAATADGLVSIRLTTYGYVHSLRTGSVVGAIGPYLPGEPRRFVAGRRFEPAAPDFRTWKANAFDGELSPDRDRLTVDLSNCLPRSGSTLLPDPGPLRLGLLLTDAAEGAAVTEGTGVTWLGEPIPYLQDGWLGRTSGLVTVDVPAGVRDTIRTHPLALVQLEPAPTVLLRETPGGWRVGVDNETRRIESEHSATFRVHVTEYGVPAGGKQLSAVSPETAAAGSPALVVHQPAATGSDGWTSVRVDVGRVGTPRAPLDGQLYELRVSGGQPAHTASVRILAFSHFEPPAHPAWQDVRTIFEQYSVLYPIMTKRLIDLSKCDEVVRHRDILRLAFSLDVSDPNSMPVTRDLSARKREMILNWLASPGMEPCPDPPAPPPGAADVAKPAVEQDDLPVSAQDVSLATKERQALRLLGLEAER